uniref:Uncharacterized protein n=1 Tax=Oryzias latipes TaxID=8090 RepID=A0A3P9KPM5_ORYLA
PFRFINLNLTVILINFQQTVDPSSALEKISPAFPTTVTKKKREVITQQRFKRGWRKKEFSPVLYFSYFDRDNTEKEGLLSLFMFFFPSQVNAGQ